MDSELEKPDCKVEVQELEDFFKRFRELDTEYERVSALKTELYKELTALELRASEYLSALGKDKYVSNHGIFSYKYEQSFLTPKSIDDKAALAAWLKERGIFEHYMTFNSMSINSLAKKEIEATGDPLLEIPGLKRGQSVLKTSFRKN